MGERSDVVIANGGFLVSFVTFFYCVWLILVDLDIIRIDLEIALFLRIIGIFIVVGLAYVSYWLQSLYIQKTEKKNILFAIFGILLIVDFVGRLLTVVYLNDQYGVLLLVLYPLVNIIVSVIVYFLAKSITILEKKEVSTAMIFSGVKDALYNLAHKEKSS